jgi:hypothetical protein
MGAMWGRRSLLVKPIGTPVFGNDKMTEKDTEVAAPALPGPSLSLRPRRGKGKSYCRLGNLSRPGLCGT